MGLDSLYFVIIHIFISEVIASYATSPYLQYAGVPYPSSGYMYPAFSYTPKSTPVYAQQYAPPSPVYQPAYPTSAPVSVPSGYAPTTTYQPSYAQVPAIPPKIPPPYQTPSVSYQPTYTQTPANPATINQVNTAKSSPSYQSYAPSRDASVATQPIPYQVSYQLPPKPSPLPPAVPNVPKIEPVAPANYVAKENLPIINPISQPNLPACVPPFDSNVLNNLAIALQLLIVSNLIHNPSPELSQLPGVLNNDVIPAIAPLSIPYIPPSSEASNSHSPAYYDPSDYQNSYFSIPNANFLGSAGYGDTGISKSMMSGYGSPSPPNPRSTGLMSPYDAISADLSSAKKESKSPYHLSSDYNDLFSLTELFKV